MTSTISLQEAAAATKRILGFYDTIPATDPKAFAAGLAATLMTFPRPVIERAMDPVKGIPAFVSYPNLAKMRELLDKWRLEFLETQERIERSQCKALPEKPRDPERDKRMSEGFKKLALHISSGFSPSSTI